MALLTCTFSFTDVSAQSEPGHVFTIRSHTVFSGKAAEYNKVYADVVRPVFAKLKADGDIVSFLDLQEVYGDQKGTHVIVMEFENFAQIDALVEKQEAASQALFGKPFQEALGDLSVLRKGTGTEVYGSTQSN
jgi:hypothetical protein